MELRHPNGYRTGYAHLSRILVKPGQKVGQGDVLGRVGSTGLATGPHLDYRVRDPRGRYLNPRRRIAWPSDKPLEERHRSAFAAVRDRFLLQLNPLLRDPETAETRVCGRVDPAVRLRRPASLAITLDSVAPKLLDDRFQIVITMRLYLA